MDINNVYLSTLLFILHWMTDSTRACKDHNVCKYYKRGKEYYCKHQWLITHCQKMCGLCTPECPTRDHIACTHYGRLPSFYCPHAWLKKNCNKMCGRCAEKEPQWPEGEYGILSPVKCPDGWFEFNHCMDSENDHNQDDTREFKLAPEFTCDKSSISFRYCFKGPSVPTRPGGFWTKFRYYGSAYVVKNTVGSCTKFGQDGGTIEIDNEDYNNQNYFGNHGLNGQRYPKYHPFDFIFQPYSRTRLSFCRIGDKGESDSTDHMEVGHFNEQKFGLFIAPDQKCPTIRSPTGILYGTKQKLFSDDENYLCRSRVVSGEPPVYIRDGGTRWGVCQYDPKEGKRY